MRKTCDCGMPDCPECEGMCSGREKMTKRQYVGRDAGRINQDQGDVDMHDESMMEGSDK